MIVWHVGSRLAQFIDGRIDSTNQPSVASRRTPEWSSAGRNKLSSSRVTARPPRFGQDDLASDGAHHP